MTNDQQPTTNADRAERVRALFDEVADLSDDDRRSVLLERYPDDAQLRAEVEALLAHDEGQVSRFLKSPLREKSRRHWTRPPTARHARKFPRRVGGAWGGEGGRAVGGRRTIIGLGLAAGGCGGALVIGLVAARGGALLHNSLCQHDEARQSATVASVAEQYLQEHLYIAEWGGEHAYRAAAGHSRDLLKGRFDDQPLVEVAIRQAVAQAYLELGEPGEAAATIEPAVNLLEAERGPGHDETLDAKIELAVAWGAAGRVEREATILERVVQMRLNASGPHSPATLDAQRLLASARSRLGQWGVAAELLESIYERSRQVRGETGEPTIQILSDRVAVLTELDRTDEAAALLEQLLAYRRQSTDPSDPATLRTVHDLAALRLRLGTLDEAEALYREAYEQRRRLHGDEHADTLASMNGLAGTLEQLGRWEEAERLYDSVIDIAHTRESDGETSRLAALTNLCRALLPQKKHAEAEPLIREALDIAERTQPGNALLIGALHASYGEALHGLGRFDEAEVALLKAVDLLKSRLGPAHIRTNRPVALLIDIFERTGRPGDAAAWREHLDGREDAGDG